LAAQQEGAFAHSEQAAGGWVERLEVEAAAMVFHLYPELAPRRRQAHLRPPYPGMSSDVGQRFLDDAEGGCFQLWG
jgi:hypothetical protein